MNTFNCQYCIVNIEKEDVQAHKCQPLWISCNTCYVDFTNGEYLNHFHVEKKPKFAGFWKTAAHEVLTEAATTNNFPIEVKMLCRLMLKKKHAIIPKDWKSFRIYALNCNTLFKKDHVVFLHHTIVQKYNSLRELALRFQENPQNEDLKNVFHGNQPKPLPGSVHSKMKIEELKKNERLRKRKLGVQFEEDKEKVEKPFKLWFHS